MEGLRDEYLETGQLTRPLIEGAIDLALIDFVYRSPPENLGEYHDGDIVDLLHLMELLNEQDRFKSADHATLNPTFGLASKLVEGADADIIIDTAHSLT